jgi:hypothetical protein
MSVIKEAIFNQNQNIIQKQLPNITKIKKNSEVSIKTFLLCIYLVFFEI